MKKTNYKIILNVLGITTSKIYFEFLIRKIIRFIIVGILNSLIITYKLELNLNFSEIILLALVLVLFYVSLHS